MIKSWLMVLLSGSWGEHLISLGCRLHSCCSWGTLSSLEPWHPSGAGCGPCPDGAVLCWQPRPSANSITRVTVARAAGLRSRQARGALSTGAPCSAGAELFSFSPLGKGSFFEPVVEWAPRLSAGWGYSAWVARGPFPDHMCPEPWPFFPGLQPSWTSAAKPLAFCAGMLLVEDALIWEYEVI